MQSTDLPVMRSHCGHYVDLPTIKLPSRTSLPARVLSALLLARLCRLAGKLQPMSAGRAVEERLQSADKHTEPRPARIRRGGGQPEGGRAEGGADSDRAVRCAKEGPPPEGRLGFARRPPQGRHRDRKGPRRRGPSATGRRGAAEMPDGLARCLDPCHGFRLRSESRPKDIMMPAGRRRNRKLSQASRKLFSPNLAWLSQPLHPPIARPPPPPHPCHRLAPARPRSLLLPFPSAGHWHCRRTLPHTRRQRVVT